LLKAVAAVVTRIILFMENCAKQSHVSQQPMKWEHHHPILQMVKPRLQEIKELAVVTWSVVEPLI
jgi:hypothetical protein